MKKQIYHRIIDIILLALFLSYSASTTLFYHCHTINGVTIVHSHLYIENVKSASKESKPISNANHKHSKSEVNLISQLSLFTSLLYIYSFFFRCLYYKTIKQILYNFFYTPLKSHILNFSLRAPPVIYC